MTEEAPLHLELRPSRTLAIWVFALHGLALGSVWLAPLPLWLAVPASLVVVAHGAWVHALHLARRLPGSVRALYWDRDQGWRLRRNDGRLARVELAGPPFVSPWLVALRLREGRWRTYDLPLFADRLDPPGARRLRRLLLRG